MNWNEFVKDYLTFTRKERIGILVITVLILATFFLPNLILKNKNHKPSLADSVWIASVKELILKDTGSPDSTEQYSSEENAYTYQFDNPKKRQDEYIRNDIKLFDFDPNTIPKADWKKLGVRDKTIETISKYLSKGGRFYKTEDLRKIYGFREDDYERLAPFVNIQSTIPKIKDQPINEKTNIGTSLTKHNSTRYAVIEINSADTADFISLPGIGSKLAARIVTFRDKLGGFYSVEQIGETYGLPDSTFLKIKQYLIVNNSSIKKININTATVEELKAHPYIKFNLANPIVAYRIEHGAFSRIEDIRNVMVITEDVYKKILPYLLTQ